MSELPVSENWPLDRKRPNALKSDPGETGISDSSTMIKLTHLTPSAT
jgi:hypothetical protein